MEAHKDLKVKGTAAQNMQVPPESSYIPKFPIDHDTPMEEARRLLQCRVKYGLMAHQMTAVVRLLRMTMRDRGGLLAHDMGTGKTLTVLWTLKLLGLHGAYNALIVAPLSVMETWRKEQQTLFPMPARMDNWWDSRQAFEHNRVVTIAEGKQGMKYAQLLEYLNHGKIVVISHKRYAELILPRLLEPESAGPPEKWDYKVQAEATKKKEAERKGALIGCKAEAPWGEDDPDEELSVMNSEGTAMVDIPPTREKGWARKADKKREGVNLGQLDDEQLAVRWLLRQIPIHVIDEAHLLTGRGTWGFKAIKDLTAHSKVILLTGTPIMNTANDLGSMMQLVNPYVFHDRNFERRYKLLEPQTAVNKFHLEEKQQRLRYLLGPYVDRELQSHVHTRGIKVFDMVIWCKLNEN